MAAVVLDHAFEWPAAGFLGVDVFFVISGFVITAGLLRERERTGRIRLRRFAVRRFRRLAPASLLVLLLTTAAAWVLLPATRFHGVATDAMWSALAVQNWRLAGEGTDYFAASAAVSPLQHFWSLGVEEQFYLVLPVLLLLLLGRGRGSGRAGSATTVLGLLTLGSLVWAFTAVAQDPAAAYFSTATRAWELGLGVVVALLVRRGRAVRRSLAETMTVVGVAAIVGAIVFGRESTGVPAPLALVPTIGTALVLMAGAGPAATAGRGSAVAAPLRWAPLVGLGTVSYSLYLWHWPFIVLLPLFTSLPMLAIVALSLLTAVASYATVETAFRQRALVATLRENCLRLQLGGIAILTVVTLITVSGTAERLKPLPAIPAAAADTGSAADGDDADEFPALQARVDAITAGLSARSWPEALTPSADAISAPGYADSLTTTSDWASTIGCSRMGADWRAASCAWGPATDTGTGSSTDAETDVLLAGDSTGAFSAPGWRALADDPDAGVRVRNAAQIGCPFSTTALRSDAAACATHNAEVVAELERTTPDLLVVTNRFWDENDPGLESIDQETYERGVREMIDAARAHVGRVVVLPATPPGYAPTSCTAGTKGPQDCRATDGIARSQMRSLTAALNGVADTLVLDSTPLWCAYGSCPLLIGDVLTRFDPVHVTPEAAQASAPALLDLLRQQEILPGVRRSSP